VEDKVAAEEKVATAPLERKPGRNRFLVDEAANDDHSVVALSKEKMQELDVYQVRDWGGAVVVA
jgi:transitional endoplasmic reticulum ATPase